MKTIRIIILNLVALFVVSACTIKQTINYNEDMSGNNEVIIDYGEFMEQMGSLMGDSSGLDKDMNMKESLGDISDAFKNLEGLTNLKTIEKSKEGIVGFSFDFTDTKNLNAAMSNYLGDEGESKKKAPKTYTQKKKKLILNFDDQDMAGMKESLGDESMMMMMGSMDYEFTINFPFAVKSVDNKTYTLSADRKSISTTISLEDFISGNESLSTKIKW